jgi:hypothetical protein
VSQFDDIRAQLRDAPQPPAHGVAAYAIGALVFAAIVSAAAYYLFFMPIKVPLRPSAAIPTFQQVNPDGSPQNVEAPVGPRDVVSTPAEYNGMSFRQTGNHADEVCFARAQARYPHWSKTPRLTTKELGDFRLNEMPHFNELVTCLLIEAPARYCSRSQRNMIAGEIAMYFHGIEAGNHMLERVQRNITAARESGRMESDDASRDINQLRQRTLVPDPRVVGGIEARLRDGTLKAADAEMFAAAAPQPLRQRFANVKPSTPLCPVQPWWAFWREL